MSISEIITISISGLGLVISVVALVMEFRTRREVRKLTKLEIEKLEREKEQQSKAILYGYIDGDHFYVENSGEAAASNVRIDGWGDYDLGYLPAHDFRSFDLCLTKDSPSQSTFKITWDDESGKGYVWEKTLNMYRD